MQARQQRGVGDRQNQNDESVGRSKKAAHYRARASECVQAAADITDREKHDQWLEIAVAWTQLALATER